MAPVSVPEEEPSVAPPEPVLVPVDPVVAVDYAVAIL